MYNKERKIIAIDDTRFIFKTNFSGDPARDSFGNDDRKVNIIIPSEEQALAIADMDIDGERIQVGHTVPRDPEDEPEYYISAKMKYKYDDKDQLDVDRSPHIYLVCDDSKPMLLNDRTVGRLDFTRIKNVNITLNPAKWEYHGKTGVSLWVNVMYVEQDNDSDPYAARYTRDDQ